MRSEETTSQPEERSSPHKSLIVRFGKTKKSSRTDPKGDSL
jgi:hypothetical protein